RASGRNDDWATVISGASEEIVGEVRVRAAPTFLLANASRHRRLPRFFFAFTHKCVRQLIITQIFSNTEFTCGTSEVNEFIKAPVRGEIALTAFLECHRHKTTDLLRIKTDGAVAVAPETNPPAIIKDPQTSLIWLRWTVGPSDLTFAHVLLGNG